MTRLTAADLVPTVDDLPGAGWIVIGDDLGGAAGDSGTAELFDCVGPDFPDQAVLETAASPHFVRPPRSLVHGVAVRFRDDAAADVAASILGGAAFARCLGTSVAADLEAQPIDAELLAVDVEATDAGQRVRFTGGGEQGVRPVHLDLVLVRAARTVGLLWFGDTPEAFDPVDRDRVVSRLSRSR